MSTIRSQSRVFGDLERRRRAEVGILDIDKVYKMKPDKVDYFSASGSKIRVVFIKEP